MKIFGGDAITKVYNTLGADENMPIDSRIISNAVENAQKKVEGRNFSIRKNVLKYDDVMNAQREIIYKQRREVLDGENIHDNIIAMIDFVADKYIKYVYRRRKSELNIESLNTEILNVFGIDMLDFIKENKDIQAISEELKKEQWKYMQQKNKILVQMK